jgi:hypothetical protein
MPQYVAEKRIQEVAFTLGAEGIPRHDPAYAVCEAGPDKFAGDRREHRFASTGCYPGQKGVEVRSTNLVGNGRLEFRLMLP